MTLDCIQSGRMDVKPLPKLLDKEKIFVLEYLVDLNATQAAIRAGYSERSAPQYGNEMKEKPHIKAAIQHYMDERAARTGITADYVLNKVKDTMERCSQAEPVMEWDPDAKEMVRTGEWKFDANGVLKGAEMLGRHLSLWKGPGEVEVKVNLTNLSDEELDKRVKELEERLAKKHEPAR